MRAKIHLETICAGCGMHFLLKPYLARKPTKYGRFCSMQCRSTFIAQYNPASQKHRIEIICAFCRTIVSLQPYRLLDGSQNHFCSMRCSTKFTLKKRWADGPTLTIVFCAQCGAEKYIPTWEKHGRTARGQEQFFCNRQCFGKWKSVNWLMENSPSWKGGWTPHGKGWAIIRTAVRDEQKHRCKDCRRSEKTLGRQLDVHHIIPARFFSTDEEASARKNLIGLCHQCHMKRERHALPLFEKAITSHPRKGRQRTRP